jgi:glycosyltransferase involved in cell wall biosynthesis
MKHIAMYIGSLVKGGAERVMCNLAEYFYEQGYKVTFVTTYLGQEEYDVPHAVWSREPQEGCRELTVLDPDDHEHKVWLDDSADGIKRVFTALPLSDRSGRIANFIKREKILRDTWKELKPDVILSFLGKNNIMAIRTARGLGIPVVVSVRSNPSREYGAKSLDLSMRYYFPKAAGVVVQTTEAAQYFGSRVKTKILPNSIHPDFINRDTVPFDARSKEIVTVGRLDDNKNQILLIKSFKEIEKEFPDYRVVIYGDGEKRKEFESAASEHVFFKGRISDVPEKIAGAEVFVLTSRQEGYPNALIEAMSLGLVCISTDCPCGGPRDLIDNGTNGLLIPMADDDKMVKDLADKLRSVLKDRELMGRMSKEAVKVRDEYNPDRINSQWKDYLEEVMKK